MGAHDWTRMPDGLFHGFHTRWLSHLTESLNAGLLPYGYSAEAEQHFGRNEGDVIALRDDRRRPPDDDAGGVAVSDTPPGVRRQRGMDLRPARRPSTLAVRRRSGTLVAVVEIVSPGNKDGRHAVEQFVRKITGALRNGVHVVLIDIHPPTGLTPGGWHPAVEMELDVLQEDPRDTSDDQPAELPVSLIAYESDGPHVEAFIEYLSFGDPLPDMPLFLAPGRYVNLPVGPTYAATVRGMSKTFRGMLTGEEER